MGKTELKEISFELFYDDKRVNTNLSVYEYGWEKNYPNKSFGPTKREYYLFHYVASGKGTYYIGEKKFQASKGDIFLIIPGEKHYYQADSEDPWEYYWIGFHGLEVQNLIKKSSFSNGNYIIHPVEEVEYIFKFIRKQITRSLRSKYLVLSKLYELFAIILDNSAKEIDEKLNDTIKEDLVSRVMKYIQENYHKKLTIEGIAKEFSVSRSYLFRMFKEKLNLSVSEYILDIRLTNACLLLKNPLLTNYQVMTLSGFSDYSNFLKLFKRKYGVSPRDYRKDPFETT